MFQLSIHSAWSEDQDLQHANVENSIENSINIRGGKSIFIFATKSIAQDN